MRIHKSLLLAAALILPAAPALAETASRVVGSDSFNFAVPTQFCVLSDSNPRDLQFINVVRRLLQGANNKLILVMVDCQRLKTYRAGDNGNIVRYAIYYTPDPYESGTLQGDNQALRKELCQDMRKQGDATLSGVKEIVAEAAKDLKANIAVNSTKYIGVIDEDSHGCYAALLIGVRGSDGKNLLMSSIVTSTVIHSKPLFFAMYNQYAGPETTQEDVARSKVVAANFDQANP
ncbi:MAG TPA: hypothetical protein VE986_11010 [Hyphomicrobiales bacterium]|nr:hypothetical protein [Hyphomicrobiales bacterium]